MMIKLSVFLGVIIFLGSCEFETPTFQNSVESIHSDQISSTLSINYDDVDWKECYDQLSKSVPLVLKNKEKMEEGEKLYNRKCKRCHGKALEGGVGPNLTDAYWIYGGEIPEMARIIINGTENGMNDFKSKLSCKELAEILAFIESKKGSDPENAKAPEGHSE